MAVRVDNRQAVLDCIPKLEAALANFPRRFTHPTDWTLRIGALQKLILTEGGAFSSDGLGSTVRLYGYKATSTTGLEGAVRNWIVQVREKLGVPA
jgi:hypothetical protein